MRACTEMLKHFINFVSFWKFLWDFQKTFLEFQNPTSEISKNNLHLKCKLHEKHWEMILLLIFLNFGKLILAFQNLITPLPRKIVILFNIGTKIFFSEFSLDETKCVLGKKCSSCSTEQPLLPLGKRSHRNTLKVSVDGKNPSAFENTQINQKNDTEWRRKVSYSKLTSGGCFYWNQN